MPNNLSTIESDLQHAGRAQRLLEQAARELAQISGGMEKEHAEIDCVVSAMWADRLASRLTEQHPDGMRAARIAEGSTVPGEDDGGDQGIGKPRS